MLGMDWFSIIEGLFFFNNIWLDTHFWVTVPPQLASKLCRLPGCLYILVGSWGKSQNLIAIYNCLAPPTFNSESEYANLIADVSIQEGMSIFYRALWNYF